MPSQEIHDPAWPRGLRLLHEIMKPQTEIALIGMIERSGLEYPAYAPDGGRASMSFGWKFDFATDSFRECAPLPDGFAAIRGTAAAHAGLPAEDLVECLLNRYDPGAEIPPHFDKSVWDCVIGVSLGIGITMHFVKDGGEAEASEAEGGKVEGGKVEVELPRRSLYILGDDARHVFKHGLPPTRETRWSITFRSYSPEGRARRAAQENAGVRRVI